MQKRTEIRDGKEYTVTVLDGNEGMPFTCFACKYTFPFHRLSRSEPYKHGKKNWFLCKGCDWKRQDRIENIKEQDLDMTRFHQTKFPFSATVNGEPITVWHDWIEREGADE